MTSFFLPFTVKHTGITLILTKVWLSARNSN